MFRFLKHLPGAALAMVCAFGHATVLAQENVIRMVVGFPAGGPADRVARPLAERLSKQLGRTIIIDNKAGANSHIAASFVAKAPADGSVLFFGTVGPIAISPSLYTSLPYNPQRDFAPVSLVVENSSILVVSASNPVTSVPEFVEKSVRAGAPLPFASTSVGSIPHMALEQLKDATQAKLLHVPYKGAGPAVVDIMGGHVAGLFADGPAVVNLIQSNQLKAIGIAGHSRLPLLPNVPTLEEQGIKGVVTNNWYGLFAPKATPPSVVSSLSAAVSTVLKEPQLRTVMLELGSVPVGSTPGDFEEIIRRDVAKWAKVIADKKIVAD